MDMRYSALPIGLFLIAVAAPAADSPIRNYEECVKAGHSTGKTAGQDVCLTPQDWRTFVKGLQPSIRQGIYGTITLRTGNCMPRVVTRGEDGTLNLPPRQDPCTVAVVDREVYIYPVLGSKYKWRGTYLPGDVAPLRVVRSKNGFYEVEVPAGSYSVLVEDEGKKYCMFGNSNDEACAVTIKAGELWEYQILINHASD
jgi:hypothetical protein